MINDRGCVLLCSCGQVHIMFPLCVLQANWPKLLLTLIIELCWQISCFVVWQGSLEDYRKASQILTDKVGADTPPEILNNIGALYYKLGQYDESKVGQVTLAHSHVTWSSVLTNNSCCFNCLIVYNFLVVCGGCIPIAMSQFLPCPHQPQSIQQTFLVKSRVHYITHPL